MVAMLMPIRPLTIFALNEDARDFCQIYPILEHAQKEPDSRSMNVPCKMRTAKPC